MEQKHTKESFWEEALRSDSILFWIVCNSGSKKENKQSL